MGPPAPAAPEPAVLIGFAYGVLAVLGVVLGLIGSFEFSWELGPVPVAAVLLSGLNLAVFWAAGWAMRSKAGAVVPAALWMIILVVLSTRRPEGDLVVTGTTQGYVYMIGGVLAALVAIAGTRPVRPGAVARPPGVREQTGR